MLRKLLLLALLVIICLSIKQRNQHLKEGEQHDDQNHDIFGIGKPSNKKNRTEAEVCKHYGGAMCTVFKIGTKCCKDGTFTKGTQCGGVGCEHDTLSISDMNWEY